MSGSERVRELQGVVPILPTPLTGGGELDEKALRHLVEHCVSEGMDAIVVLGSNGEFPYLSFDEKRRVMAVAAEAAEGQVPVIGSASACGTDVAVDLAKAAADSGCSAVMAALPLYFDLDAGGAVAHMSALAEEGGLPVFYYHYPDVTGLALTPPEIARIAALPDVVGAKITVVNAGFLGEVIEATRPHGWRVFTGTSFLLRDCVEKGGAGVFCPLPLLAPKQIRALYEAARTGDETRAEELQAHVRGAIPIMSGIDAPIDLLVQGFEAAATSPYQGTGPRSRATHALLKEALRLCGHPIEPGVKRPYVPASAQESALIERTLGSLGWVGA